MQKNGYLRYDFVAERTLSRHYLGEVAFSPRGLCVEMWDVVRHYLGGFDARGKSNRSTVVALYIGVCPRVPLSREPPVV